MYRGARPKILPVFITIVVIVIVIAVAVTLVRSMLQGGDNSDNKSDQSQEQTLQSVVVSQEATRSVRWTVRGPIVADEKFKSYQIVVTPTTRTFTVYNGYLDKVESQKTYDNNATAYEQFTYALDKANIGMIRGKEDDSDIRGVCATEGIVYKFETVNGGEADHTVWSSSCKDSPGTMGAEPLKIQALFVNQIPDFKPIFNNIY